MGQRASTTSLIWEATASRLLTEWMSTAAATCIWWVTRARISFLVLVVRRGLRSPGTGTHLWSASARVLPHPPLLLPRLTDIEDVRRFRCRHIDRRLLRKQKVAEKAPQHPRTAGVGAYATRAIKEMIVPVQGGLSVCRAFSVTCLEDRARGDRVFP
jgi:hypothetical protein